MHESRMLNADFTESWFREHGTYRTTPTINLLRPDSPLNKHNCPIAILVTELLELIILVLID